MARSSLCRGQDSGGSRLRCTRRIYVRSAVAARRDLSSGQPVLGQMTTARSRGLRGGRRRGTGLRPMHTTKSQYLRALRTDAAGNRAVAGGTGRRVLPRLITSPAIATWTRKANAGRGQSPARSRPWESRCSPRPTPVTSRCCSAPPRRWVSSAMCRRWPSPLHHLDLRWRPAHLKQRDGRILRQGNRKPPRCSSSATAWSRCDAHSS